ncbi:MAG: hypothetical protein PVH88_17020 [Ignavibacteria bacterium]|jgi:hypothetical protein
MKSVTSIAFAFLLLTFSLNQAQSYRNSTYFSGHLGARSSTVNSRGQSSGLNASFGAGFGFPIYKNISFYSKVTYYLNDDFTTYDNVQQLSSDFQLYNTTERINGSFSQLIMNTGLQYNIRLSEEFNLGFNGGFTYSLINQEAKLSNGTIISSVTNEGAYGYFGGGYIEKRFKDENFAMFAEAQYNYIDGSAIYFRDRFSGTNVTIGARYYLSGY